MDGQLPPPPCESNTKVPKSDGNSTECCSDKGVDCARCGKTQAATSDHCIMNVGESLISTVKGQEEMKKGGKQYP